MCNGVSKSGSPAPKPITSNPEAFSSAAFAVAAMVGDGFIFKTLFAKKFILRPHDSVLLLKTYK